MCIYIFSLYPLSSYSTEEERGKMKNQQLKKRMWKPEEDMILKSYVEIHGEGNWAAVSKKLGLGRDARSCRLRWKNYLRPDIKHGSMSKDEEDLIIRMHKLIGNRWSLIAGRLPGRSDNEVKNYWNTYLSKKQINRQAKRKPSTQSTELEKNHENDKKRAKMAGLIEQSGREHHNGSTQERNNETAIDGVKEEKINNGESKDEIGRSLKGDELLVGSDSGNINCGIMDMDFSDDGNAFMICGGEYDHDHDHDEPLVIAWDHASYVLFDTLGSNWEDALPLP